jgi:protein TonB
VTVTSGSSARVAAAVEAVRQWVYQPTLLNGNPVEVATTVEVNFTLSGQ